MGVMRMKNKVSKIIFSVILLGVMVIPLFGTGSTNVNTGIFTTQGFDSPIQGQ